MKKAFFGFEYAFGATFGIAAGIYVIELIVKTVNAKKEPEESAAE